MKKVLFGLAALPFLAGVALAADRLSDDQMDGVSAGATSCTGTGTGTCSTSGFSIPANASPVNLDAILNAYFSYLSGKGFAIQTSP